MSQVANPFSRDSVMDKPGIIGARWWNKALQTGGNLHGRRAALTGVLVVGGGVALLGGLTIWAVAKAGSSSDDTREESRRSLEMQRDYGWNFGATSETVAFDAQYTQSYAREALKQLESDLAPSGSDLAPYYSRTLFQSPEALPKLTLPDETTPITPLAVALRPILTPDMKTMTVRGAAFARAVKASSEPILTLVDLPGPLSVAFAAGAAEVLDPVFTFENWPHPRGVVPAHLALAAAVYFQPALVQARSKRPPDAPPIFVLDRQRLAPYTDAASQFDNRYLTKLPPKPLGFKRVLYVVPTQTDLPELDDLNATFTAWRSAGADIRAFAVDSLSVVPGSDKVVYGTGTTGADTDLLTDYGWGGGGGEVAPKNLASNRQAAQYRPTSRAVTVSDASIGTAAVVVAAGTGLLIGSKLNRSGSWNRSSGGYGG